MDQITISQNWNHIYYILERYSPRPRVLPVPRFVLVLLRVDGGLDEVEDVAGRGHQRHQERARGRLSLREGEDAQDPRAADREAGAGGDGKGHGHE